MSKSLTSSTVLAPPIPETDGEAVLPFDRRKLLFGVAAAILIGASLVWGARRIGFALSHEETDDAQVEGDVSPVLPRVTGYVSRVLVHDNERVTADQPLVELDSRELDLKVAHAQAALESAQAALANARATLANAQAALAVAQANAAVAAVRDEKAAGDFRRDQALFHNEAISDRDYTDSRAVADVARAEHAEADRQVEAARTQAGIAQTGIASASAEIDARQSDLGYARLQRSYAVVVAPIAGVVSRKSIEPGEYVEAGQTLLSITSDRNPWVVANFKETQISRIRAGQPVEFTVDGWPGVTFQGRVDSISGATGARFALLPPDNASGNFVKVTQRVPVKIVLAEGGPALRQGMSVDAAVRVRD